MGAPLGKDLPLLNINDLASGRNQPLKKIITSKIFLGAGKWVVGISNM